MLDGMMGTLIYFANRQWSKINIPKANIDFETN